MGYLFAPAEYLRQNPNGDPTTSLQIDLKLVNGYKGVLKGHDGAALQNLLSIKGERPREMGVFWPAVSIGWYRAPVRHAIRPGNPLRG